MKIFSENLRIFRKVALPLFILIVVSNTFDQYLNLNIEQAMQSPEGLSAQTYVLGFLSILSGIFFPVLLLTVTMHGCMNNSGEKKLSGFIAHYGEQIIIENLRAWGKALSWSLIFIVPGIWKYIELSLTPFIVICSTKYDDGKIDALTASTWVFRRHWLKIFSILILFHMFIPLILTTFFDSYRLIWKTPFSSLILSLLDTYVLVFSTQLLTDVILQEVNKHESHI